MKSCPFCWWDIFYLLHSHVWLEFCCKLSDSLKPSVPLLAGMHQTRGYYGLSGLLPYGASPIVFLGSFPRFQRIPVPLLSSLASTAGALTVWIMFRPAWVMTQVRSLKLKVLKWHVDFMDLMLSIQTKVINQLLFWGILLQYYKSEYESWSAYLFLPT